MTTRRGFLIGSVSAVIAGRTIEAALIAGAAEAAPAGQAAVYTVVGRRGEALAQAVLPLEFHLPDLLLESLALGGAEMVVTRGGEMCAVRMTLWQDGQVVAETEIAHAAALVQYDTVAIAPFSLGLTHH